jgi:integrase
MLKPTTPLADVFAQYLADAREELGPRTWQPYKSHLTMALRAVSDLLALEAHRRAQVAPGVTLADFVPANFTKYLRTLKKDHIYSARGKAIALRAVGTYLAEGEYWYYGEVRARVSVMAELEIPEMPSSGRPVYADHELVTIREAAASHPTRPYFHAAMQMVHELGLRAGFEAMTLRLADVHLPQGRNDDGYIQVLEKNSKTPAGARAVPLEPAVVEAIQRYLRMERPPYLGPKDEEALLLTVDGTNYAYSGWNSMLQRFKGCVKAADPDMRYQASRNRGTRTFKLRESRDYSDSEIMQLQGWSSPKMIGRYSGRLPRSAFRGRRGTTAVKLAMPIRRLVG